MRISDWSSDVCSSDLTDGRHQLVDPIGDLPSPAPQAMHPDRLFQRPGHSEARVQRRIGILKDHLQLAAQPLPIIARSEEHTSELQSLMRISYAVLCLKKKK